MEAIATVLLAFFFLIFIFIYLAVTRVLVAALIFTEARKIFSFDLQDLVP